MGSIFRARFALLLSFSLAGSTVDAVDIIAHRGASADAPENTLSAMKLGWQQNADAVELDIWLSKDGKIIVFHDATTKRYDGKTHKISDLTWAETQKIDVGSWKGEAFKGERIPTLESILATVPKGRKAVIEIKCGPEVVPEMVRIIRESGRASNELVVISFDYDSLLASKKALPAIPHHFLHGYEKDKTTGELPQLAPMIALAKEAKFDGLNLHFRWPITKEFVHQVHGAGLKMLVWTVDDAAIAKRLVDAGVDAITTNKPEWLRAQLQAK